MIVMEDVWWTISSRRIATPRSPSSQPFTTSDDEPCLYEILAAARQDGIDIQLLVDDERDYKVRRHPHSKDRSTSGKQRAGNQGRAMGSRVVATLGGLPRGLLSDQLSACVW